MDEQGSTNILGGAAFSIADDARWGANTFVSNLNKAVCASEAAGVSGGAYGGCVIGVSALGTVLSDLWKIW